MAGTKYAASLIPGTRVLFAGGAHHAKNGQYCTILSALPNPSLRPENQWYDVRFDEYSLGRFNERFLKPEDKEAKREVE